MDAKNTFFGSRVVPEGEKKGLVKGVFDSVADRYDLMNDVMSLGTHRLWKRLLVEKTRLRPGQSAIDIAAGTADISMLLKQRVGDAGSVVAYDINNDMLRLGRDKCIDRGLVKGLSYVQGDAEDLPFEDNSFHAVTIGFGIRNVTRLDKALGEMYRVARPGARVVCLEFSHPSNPLFSRLYDLYSFNIIPLMGQAIAGDKDSYVYLVESIRKFPGQERFKEMMEEAGFFRVSYTNLFDGVAAIHAGIKV